MPDRHPEDVRVEADPSAEFTWNRLTIRWNPRTDIGQHWEDGYNVTLGGILTLQGFTRENGAMTNCDFVLDGSLPKGTMVVSPAADSAVREGADEGV